MAPMQIVMSARAVVSSGAPFGRWGEPFSDPDVALDEISALRPHGEPVVLRVDVVGGTMKQRAELKGDWLCDVRGQAPARLPVPRWAHSAESAEFSRRRSWLDAWELCGDARWMLDAAADEGVDLKLVVLAACACARTSLHLIPSAESRPVKAIDVAESWARGTASPAALRAARASASQANGDSSAMPIRARAAVTSVLAALNLAARIAVVADAGDDPADVTGASWEWSYGDVAAHVAHTATAALGNMGGMADLVRKKIPTIAVLRAVADNARRRGRRPLAR